MYMKMFLVIAQPAPIRFQVIGQLICSLAAGAGASGACATGLHFRHQPGVRA
jgi:hypothetical protein